jgi:hypothetical protein
MDQTTLIVAIVIVAVIAGVAVWAIARQRRSEDLRRRFGPEYGRAVGEYGSTGKAESALDQRVKRVERLHLRPLSPEEHERFSREWRQVQARFVEQPPQAVAAADRLVNSLMEARGYPMGEFDQRAADISVDHPVVVENYRSAHGIVSREGTLSTEDLRRAMVHYRALFDDLLEVTTTEEREPEPQEVRR